MNNKELALFSLGAEKYKKLEAEIIAAYIEQQAKEVPVLPEPDVYEYDIETAMNVLKAHSPDQLQAYGQQCAAHTREVTLNEAMRRVRGATGGAIQPNDWWVGFKTARAQFTNAIEQLKAGK